jgi:DNA-binding NarL/FixJ family response regulator
MATAALAITAGTALRPIPRRIRVLTVDSQQLVQEGLAATLNREEDMIVVATASIGAEALDDVRRYRPDVVTLDLLLPDMPGEELARRILAEFPHIRIVAITSAHDHMHVRRALDAGVHGYLPKSAPLGELVDAIRQVKAGGWTVPGPVACQAPGALSAREVQVLQLAAWGIGNRQVAAQLSIACAAVRMHMKNILAKLGANDRAHAVTIAVTRGILRLGDWSNSELERAAHA